MAALRAGTLAENTYTAVTHPEALGIFERHTIHENWWLERQGGRLGANACSHAATNRSWLRERRRQ